MDKYREFAESASRCIEKLLRSDVFKPFGLALLRYDIVFTEHVPLGAPAATDYKRIYINPNDDFFSNCKVPVDYVITFMLTHEIGHIIFMHDMRLGSRDKQLWGYAIDFMLNLFLKNIERENKEWETQQRLIGMDIESFSHLILYDESFENMLEEEIYEKLQEDGNFKKEQSQQSYKQFLDDVGVPSDGVGDDEQIEITKTELEINGTTKKKVFIDFPKIEAPAGEESEDASLDVQLAKSMFESNILSRGFESSSFEKFLNKMFNAKIPWQTILQDSILVELQKSTDVSYGRPRLAWLSNPTLPYLPNYDDEEVLGTLALLIDESGSIADEDLAIAIDIAQQADSYYKNILAIKHDTKATWFKLYPDKLTQEDIDELLVRRHAGGTSHKDAFRHVVEFDRDPGCFISLVLSVTDMASDISDAQYILPKHMPRIYLQNDSSWEYGEVIGKVIRIS